MKEEQIQAEIQVVQMRVATIREGYKKGLKFEDMLKNFPLIKIRESRMKKQILMYQFAEILKVVGEAIGFKVSARGWAYQLETFGICDKSEFDKVQKLINDCRKIGLLPIDFVAEETSRQFTHVFNPNKLTTQEALLEYFEEANDRANYYIPDYWVDEKYYIQVLVEKIDLVTLFEPTCQNYRIPIASSKGWSSISQRWELIQRFKYHEDEGRIPVLLYCGDFDPSGLKISDLLKKNFGDLYQASKWDPYKNLIVDRFGLNYDFIE
ncbi:hypothetical protein LCGC14_2983640, partial [marine sediment metagenome]